MTKKKRLILVIGLVLVGTAALVLSGWDQPVSLDFAETVTIRSTKEGADWEVIVTDKADIQRLISICSKNEPYPSDECPGPKYGLESFRCPFYYELTFSGNENSVQVCPASDGCPPILFNGKLRKLANHYDTKDELNDIIGRYTDGMTA